jgi:hypothetical protein
MGREDHEYMLAYVVFKVPVRHLNGDFKKVIWEYR